jgi:hypothetical protein
MSLKKCVIEDGKEYEVQIEYNGNSFWFLNEGRHREKGPAIIHRSGYIGWWQNCLIHRLDGPARIWANGYKEWWISNRAITEQTHTKVRTMLAFGLDKI